MTRTDAGVFPHSESYAPDIRTDLWNPFGATVEFIATELLFAQLAYVDKLGVRFLRTNVDDLAHRIEIMEIPMTLRFMIKMEYWGH